MHHPPRNPAFHGIRDGHWIPFLRLHVRVENPHARGALKPLIVPRPIPVRESGGGIELAIPSPLPKPRRKGRRKGVNILIGLILIGSGLLVFRYSSLIADGIGGYISPPPQGQSNITGLAGTQAWYLPYAVWGFGFSLLGLGANMIRSSFMSSMMGAGAGGGMGGAASMSPEVLDSYMQQAMSTTRGLGGQSGTAPAAAKEVVKVKCRNCGSLEAEDSAYCRKCGKPI